MNRIKIPEPPHHSSNSQCIIQEGLVAGYIWIFTDKGAETIATQYANAEEIQEALQVSRATAYRIIQRQAKRYWCSDVRDAEHPRCYSVIPRKALEAVSVQGIGNPNFTNGIYQQGIARRRGRYKRR